MIFGLREPCDDRTCGDCGLVEDKCVCGPCGLCGTHLVGGDECEECEEYGPPCTGCGLHFTSPETGEECEDCLEVST